MCEEDIARLSKSLLSLNDLNEVDKGGGQNSHDEIEEGGFKSQDEVEEWISKCPLFIKMFDRVFYSLFPVISVSGLSFVYHYFVRSSNILNNENAECLYSIFMHQISD